MVVGKTGFEPATPWSQTKCSTKLSYFPFMARPRGVEPLTPRSVVWCSIQLSYGRHRRRPDVTEPPGNGKWGQAASLSSSRRIDSPITLVPTLAVPGAMMSAVRSPEARTFVQARSISAASSSMLKE